MNEVEKTLEKFGEIMVDRIKKKLLSGNKSATGNLINSITWKYANNNGMYLMQISANKSIIYVDRGRRAGAKQPPIAPIQAWIKAKRIKVNVPKKSKKSKTKTDPTRGLAFAIAKSISKKGIKPFPILNEATKITQSPVFKKQLNEAIKKDLNAQLNLLVVKGFSK